MSPVGLVLALPKARPGAPECQPAGRGDGEVQGDEECDDGDANKPADENYDDCSETRTLLPRCGDGIIQAPWEACDDACDDDGDGCTNACTIASCGDGIVQEDEGEECDDGNTSDEAGGHINSPFCCRIWTTQPQLYSLQRQKRSKSAAGSSVARRQVIEIGRSPRCSRHLAAPRK